MLEIGCFIVFEMTELELLRDLLEGVAVIRHALLFFLGFYTLKVLIDYAFSFFNR